MSKIDPEGNTLKILEDGLVKIDQVTAFRKVERDGVIYLQFCDHDRMRSNCRGSRFIEIPLSVIVEKMNE